jgi:hypothetical protein
MSPTIRLAITALVLQLGCSSHSGNGTLIGATCKHASECGPAGICVTSGKDGLCSLPCMSAGDLNDCPLGTYCDRRNLKTDVAAATPITLCLPACTDKSNCRSGYDCNGVSSGPGKVCAPH